MASDKRPVPKSSDAKDVGGKSLLPIKVVKKSL